MRGEPGATCELTSKSSPSQTTETVEKKHKGRSKEYLGLLVLKFGINMYVCMFKIVYSCNNSGYNSLPHAPKRRLQENEISRSVSASSWFWVSAT